jgi:gluconokinase
MVVVMMGVSGSGKTSVGRRVAEAQGWPFIEGDDFHPPANVEKMRNGTPLDDADRWPWLDRLADEIAAIDARGGSAVLACSALKQAYRERLASKVPPGTVRFVHLKGTYDDISARVATRKHRYMPASLLSSQFATLEPPHDAIVIGEYPSSAERAAAVLHALGVRDRARNEGQSGVSGETPL